MATDKTRVDLNVPSSSSTSRGDSGSSTPLTSSSLSQGDIFSNLTKSKLYQLVPPPLKTVGFNPLFSIGSFRDSNGSNKNDGVSNTGDTGTFGSTIADMNKLSFTRSFDSSSLFPKFESFDFNIPDINSILADKVEDWIAQHTRALVLGVGLGAAVSVGVGVGLLAAGFPQWFGDIYKRGRRWIVYRLRGRNLGEDAGAADGIKGIKSGAGSGGEGLEEGGNGRRRTAESPSDESVRAGESSAAMAHIEVGWMGQSSSEEGDEIESHEKLDYTDGRKPVAPGSTQIAILGAGSSWSPSSHPSDHRIIVIQGNPHPPRFNHHTSEQQQQQQQQLINIDQSTTQCRECLDSITATLGKHMLTWNSVGRISAHVVLNKCSGTTFRSVLTEYPILKEEVIITVYFVQRLENLDDWVQVEALASG